MKSTNEEKDTFFEINLRLPFYLQTWFICIIAAFSYFVVPAVIALFFFILQQKNIKKILNVQTEALNKKIPPEYRTVVQLEAEIEKRQEAIKTLNNNINIEENELSNLKNTIEVEKINFENIHQKCEKEELSVKRASKRATKLRELYKSMEYAIEKFFNNDSDIKKLLIPENDLNELESTSPSIMLKLHCMDIKDLRKAYRDNDKIITTVLNQYSARYTTKTNQAIYSLMVIALRSELQNVLVDLKYEKLDKCLADIKTITDKYLKIASDGNQNIAGTLTKFIGEIEYLFINAAKIEYNYYVKKEQARQEQLAIKEKMREEAAERKALAEERKKIENEEIKFETEIAKIQEQISTANTDEVENLKKRILELQSQLSDVRVKKEDIVNLQNGKAGTVYVISNLGSFGEDVFKVGMTRRLDPQERINELGSASVPFSFDVHSFIFSEDAVSLENKMHELLNSKRLNKVNPRKEFFKVSIDELEQLVNEIEPTAEFTRTMMANEYRQSLSTNENYTSDFVYDDDEEGEEI